MTRALALTLPLLLLGRGAARGQAVLDVSGSVVSLAPRLEVRVVVANRGTAAVGPLDVVGELADERVEARLTAGLAAGGEGAVLLAFTPSRLRAGTHALTLHLEHPVAGPPDAAGNPATSSQLAWLVIAIGASPPPAVRVSAERLTLDVRGELRVRLESADGAAHRVRLRAVTARGLRTQGGDVEVLAPATGTASAALGVVRAGAARGSRHAVLVVADVADEPLARTAVGAAPVEIAAFPSRLPRLRPVIFAVGSLLLALALGFEVWRRFRA